MNVDNTKIISFCTGYGGIERGLERALGKLQPLAYAEVEAYAIANLLAKMESGQMVSAPVWTDVKTFPNEIFQGCVDILIGGYPCQPFSAAGKRQGTDDPRHLWPFIRNSIDIIRPKTCFFENVEGHISMGLSTVISDLEDLGYKVSWGIFSAAEVGAPHQRKRVFILGNSKHNGLTPSKDRGSISTEQEERGVQESEGRCEQPRDELADTEGDNEQGCHLRQGEMQLRGSGSESRIPCPRNKELADTEGRNARKQETRDRGEGFGRGSEELAESDSNGCIHSKSEVKSTERGVDALGDTPSSSKQELADSSSKGCQGDKLFGNNQEEASRGEAVSLGATTKCGNDGQRWPARPGQPQYSWEEPRTIAKSKLGRTSDGTSLRIDRLRLLGNGVVPQTAYKAFITLSKELNNGNL